MINLNYVSFVGQNLPRKPQFSGAVSRDVRPVREPSREPQARACSDPFVTWLLNRAGVQPGTYRPGVLARRVPACLRTLRVRNAEAAQDLLLSRPDLLPRAVSSVLLGVSEFFRDAPVFEVLEKQALPELTRSHPRIRVLSVGCSEGQELYSVAILLAECGALERSEFLGIDCRPNALSAAANGTFKADEVEAVPARLRERYFQMTGNLAQADPALRRKMRWMAADALSDPLDGSWEMILFRNVSIYWKPQRASEAQATLANLLVPGGLLVTGKAERLPSGMGLSRIGPCIYRKTIS